MNEKTKAKSFHSSLRRSACIVSLMTYMKRYYIIILALALCGQSAYGQNNSSTPAPNRPAQSVAPQTRPPAGFDLAEYGVSIQPDKRLIIMMAALDAAGFDPTPAGKEPGAFRAQVRRDQADLDPDLSNRLRTFYERYKLAAPATPADQAARYVSLAYALGPPPALEAPPRTDDLPAGVLDVLDFAPLVREFYRKSGIDERLAAYMKDYQREGERLQIPTAEMVRSVLSYLHTRPLTVAFERVPANPPAQQGARKKDAPKYTTRERQRSFYIVPDLLAAPGAINFRVIADDYYAVVPPGTDPASSEVRRAYLQYVIDPLVVRFSKDIAARREQIKQLLSERTKVGGTVTPDIFLTVTRSLVAAADARLEAAARVNALRRKMGPELQNAKDGAARDAVLRKAQARLNAINDDAVALLVDDYERGAVLDFYFADQLRGVESSGFDVANFFTDMMNGFDPAREKRRPEEYAAARTRSRAARESRLAQGATAAADDTDPDSSRRTALVKKLVEVEELLRTRNYEAADARLRTLLQEYPGEPRILFGLGQAASLAAANATDENLQSQRLNSALADYRLAVANMSEDSDRALISRSHEAMGRILAFLDRKDEALKEFDAAIKIGNVPGGAFQDALAGREKLTRQQ